MKLQLSALTLSVLLFTVSSNVYASREKYPQQPVSVLSPFQEIGNIDNGEEHTKFYVDVNTDIVYAAQYIDYRYVRLPFYDADRMPMTYDRFNELYLNIK